MDVRSVAPSGVVPEVVREFRGTLCRWDLLVSVLVGRSLELRHEALEGGISPISQDEEEEDAVTGLSHIGVMARALSCEAPATAQPTVCYF